MLNNKVIIVTGGEGLIGKEIVNDIRKKGGIAISADITHQTNLEKFKLNFDVTSKENIEDGYNKIIEKFKKITEGLDKLRNQSLKKVNLELYNWIFNNNS